ncbi:MFS transporter [Leclercia adecarboxylata]|nr:MFS transporter [Leclercia adecarboxylata]MEB6377816.1 MFS transporter [Leclercia adecarboxylata]
MSLDSGQADDELIKKVSGRLVWFLFLLYVFAFLDRINIGFAGLTMSQDLGLTATMFGLATTFFYIAYIAFSIPGNIALGRFGARRWLAIIMIVWGLASTATLFAHDAQSLYILRTLVGIAEAGFIPGILLYLTFWFPQACRGRTNALFMIATPVTTALGSVVSGYILEMNGVLGLKGWQWLFLLEGLPSVVLGIAVLFYLDDNPMKANWLTREEKARLTAMLAAEQPQEVIPEKQKGSLISELCQPVIIKFALAYLCLVNTLSLIGIWIPQIVKSFNAASSNITIGLLAAIPQICTIIGMIWWSARSDRHRERKWHIALPMLFAAVGWLLTAYAGNPVIRLAGIAMASTGGFCAMAIFWTAPDKVLSSRSKPVGIALINAVGNIGSALSAFVVGYLKDMTNSFSTGLLYAVVVLVLGTLFIIAIPVQPATGKQNPTC